MLILNRNREESIFIGDNIEVRVLSIQGKQVRIGISAPKNISVHREEIYRRIKENEGQNNTAV